MKAKLLPDVKELKKMFYLDSSIPNGLAWKVDRVTVKCCGEPAGGLDGKSGNQYYSTRINGKLYKNHRIIYSIFHNINLTVDQLVDHIDRNTQNNNPNNLRIVTSTENQRNRTKQKATSSKYICVYFNKNRNQFQCSIRVNGKNIYLGLFQSEKDAALAYNNYIISNNLTHFNLNIIE